jgi:diguanylate cyclase (GGDEF)-like protein
MLNIALFYLLPVVWITLLVGVVPGLCLTFISVAASVLAWRKMQCVCHNEFPLPTNAVLLFVLCSAVVWLAYALRCSLERVEELSRHDPLTQAYNARAFYQILQIESHRCRRYNRPLAIAYIDCDDFNVINTNFGQHKGDEVLKLTSEIIRQGLRLTDTFARMPGDEFAVILPETHNRDAKNIFLRIRKALSENMVLKDVHATYSIGVVTFLNPPETLEVMVPKAQALMQEVKKSGKNMVNAEVFGASNTEKGL